MTVYRFIAGRIHSGDRILTLAQAVAQRRFYAEDIADMEARFGDTDPNRADFMIDYDLEMVRQLRRVIALARAANDATDPTTPDTDPSGSALAVPVQPELAA